MTDAAVAPARHVDAELLRDWTLPALGAGADKRTRGDVLVVGGSRQIPGSVLLAATAALHAGAGRVQVATARSAAVPLAVAFPEARVLGLAEGPTGELEAGASHVLERELKACRALLVGPGMCEHAMAVDLVQHYAQVGQGALVIDAAALRAFVDCAPTLQGVQRGVVVTPHAGEMAEMWGCSREQVLQDPLSLSREAARAWGAVVVLKGATTIIAAPDGSAFRNTAGNSGLATAGSGDVLAGLLAGLAARGATALQAAVWSVYLHAKAGEALADSSGPLGYLARELSPQVPKILAELSR